MQTTHYSGSVSGAVVRLGLSPELGRAAHRVWLVLGVAMAVFAWLWLLSIGSGVDSFAYWSVNPAQPYMLNEGDIGAFTYSPVAALMFAPFHQLPYPMFFAAWTTLSVVAALWLCPPVLWVPGIALLLTELHLGNVDVLIAAAVVLALTRSSGWWAAPALLKVTPGVGILWHAVRREWRELGVSIVVVVVLVALSVVIAAPLWAQWFDFLLRNVGGRPTTGTWIDVSLLLRLPAAALVVMFAARTDRRWLVPLAAGLALPVLWPTSIPAFVLGALRLWATRR